VVFSVREAKQLYQRALDDAWRGLETRLRDAEARTPGRKLSLVQVSYNPSPDESAIEELPEQPNSSRPKEVEVSVRLRATYVVR